MLLVRYMLITGRIFLASPSIQPAYKVPAKRHLNYRKACKKAKRRASAQRLSVRCFALPFAPARLADGLELEVFYVTLICITLRPVFRLAELWFPRVGSASLRSYDFGRQSNFKSDTTPQNERCNKHCLGACKFIIMLAPMCELPSDA